MKKWISVNGRLIPAAMAAASQTAYSDREERATMAPRGTVDRDGRVSVSPLDLETPSQYRRRFEAAERKAYLVEDGVTVLDATGRPVDVGG